MLALYTDGRKGVLEEAGEEQHNIHRGGAKRGETRVGKVMRAGHRLGRGVVGVRKASFEKTS